MNECRLMTLNILTDGLYNHGDSRFIHRWKAIREMIRTADPDLIGTQELTKRMKPYFKELSDVYDLCGEPRGSRFNNESSAILYRKSKYRLLETKTY